MDDKLIIGNREFSSRLIVGTGKFPSAAGMIAAIVATGAEIITVALRRVDLKNPQDNLMSVLDRSRYIILPNTSGAHNAEEAVRLARIGKASGVSDWVKLEVTPDPDYLMPDGIETLKAAEILVKEGFKVMPYIHADPILAKRLEEAGTVSVMPLAAPIGSNMGMKAEEFIRIIIEQSNLPVIVDAGLGRPSDAARALELGADAVLINTAIATAQNPVLMAEAFALAVAAGRKAYLSGLAPESKSAHASSTLDWISTL